MQHNKGTVK